LRLPHGSSIIEGEVPFLNNNINSISYIRGKYIGFAYGKGDEANKEMSAKEYKKQFGWAVSTIKSITADVYKVMNRKK